MKYYESFREQTNCYTVEGVLDYFNKRIRVDTIQEMLKVLYRQLTN